ncbi:MAG TPA: 2-hydroxychromene-2-carboxylate isomerase [Burkholderiaceae bacterium]|jgi:2-hydroxychromene-2-carboxylate isomerase|nr:2-hydroxychromene-2-carboxylate isomerase [Burkholderiaceae bacterium]
MSSSSLTPLRFWFDPISPYAWLAFQRLPQLLQGHSVVVDYQPVLFAGLLKHWGQLGPAEIAPKRDWTWRQVGWQAQRHGVTLKPPAQHPFNPLGLLRLLLACAPQGGTPSRHVCTTVLEAVWTRGGAADDLALLAELQSRLNPRLDLAGDEVRQALRAATDAALQRGLFGVPTVEVLGEGPQAGRLYWGHDGLEMLAAALDGDPWLQGPQGWDGLTPQAGLQRSR